MDSIKGLDEINYNGGLLVVVSAPSGGGKTTILRAVEKNNPEFDYSISATTRPKRSKETHGKDYYFISNKEFDDYVKEGKFIEWAEVHGNRYGTFRESIEIQLSDGKVVLLDIDVIGGMNVKKQFPHNSLLVFLFPPSEKELINRLEKRRSESKEEIEKRISRLPMEMSYVDEYDVKIVNYEFNETVRQVEQEILKYQSKIGGLING